MPVAGGTSAYLKRPIERSPWMINHDSIVIVKKLGEGTIDREKKTNHRNPPMKKSISECEDQSHISLLAIKPKVFNSNEDHFQAHSVKSFWRNSRAAREGKSKWR